MRFRAFEFARGGLLVLAAASMMPIAGCGRTANTSGTSASQQTGGARTTLPPGKEWAAWINRDIQIDLQDLPRVYTCNELWYKFHAILLAIGAREYMSIEPYNCGKGASGGRSPSVHLRFLTLIPVTGDQVRWANTGAQEKTVVLAPGEPKRLEPGDCALVKQLQGTLFAYLGVPVSTARFDCSAPAAHDFELSARLLERWPEKPPAE